MKSKFLTPAVFLLSIIAAFSLLFFLIPPEKALLNPAGKENQNQKETLHFVALGDSLTEGVGDETDQGGFVPLVSRDLQKRYHLESVEEENYGIAGERSDQINQRVKDDSELKRSLKSADVITLTVGGNDIMKVIQTNLLGLTVQSFKKPMEKYNQQLTDLLRNIRKLNSKAPIYVVGVYNPFYLSFPEIKDMQTIIDEWNKTTEKVVKDQQETHFVPVNDLLYKGLDGQQAIGNSEEEKSKETKLNKITNDALSTDDNFHPNHLGYRLMANALTKELVDTQDEWLLKEQSDGK